MKKYYVVFNGRTKGVFDSLVKCLEQVHGTSNCYQSFNTWGEVIDAVMFDMPDTGPYIYNVRGQVINFRTYEYFRKYVMERNFDKKSK